MEYEARSGQLIERDKVEGFFEDRIVEFKQGLLGRGRRLSLKLAGKTAQECQAILNEDALYILGVYSRGDILTAIKEMDTEEKL